MTRIIHLSDLHFGRARPELLEPLSKAVRGAEADLVVVSGDLTQRARSREFTQARAFLDGLGARWLAVPGNHDIPLFQPLTRILRPFRKYREHISLDLEPVFENDRVIATGLNTVNRFVHQSGIVRTGAMRRVCSTLEASDDRLKIVVAHHPFEQSGDTRKRPMRGAGFGMKRLTDCGADLILSGHLHMWHTGPFLANEHQPGPVQIHAGTSLSSRLRGEVNDFAIVDVLRSEVEVTRMAVADPEVTFAVQDCRKFDRASGALLPNRPAAQTQ